MKSILSGIILAVSAAFAEVEAKPVFTGELARAIATVESNGNNNAVGDNGRAVGKFQIWETYVDDVNRICALKKMPYKFSYEDRKDPAKAVLMVKIYTEYYGEIYELRTGNEATDETLARIHNGGGWQGALKPCTAAYWQKVKKQIGDKK